MQQVYNKLTRCFPTDRIKRTDSDKLQNEYARLVEGLQDADAARDEDSFMSNPSQSRVYLRFAALSNAVDRQFCQTISSKKLYRATLEERNTLLPSWQGLWSI